MRNNRDCKILLAGVVIGIFLLFAFNSVRMIAPILRKTPAIAAPPSIHEIVRGEFEIIELEPNSKSEVLQIVDDIIKSPRYEYIDGNIPKAPARGEIKTKSGLRFAVYEMLLFKIGDSSWAIKREKKLSIKHE